MVYDAADGYVVLLDSGLLTNVSQTWVFQGTSWSQLFPPVSPLHRSGEGMAYDAHDGYIVLFGGATWNSCLGKSCKGSNETWTFRAGVWTNITSSLPNAPSGRWAPAMTYDPTCLCVILFGGWGTSFSSLNDTWAYASGRWTNLTTSLSYTPPARGWAGMAFDSSDSDLVLFGGGQDIGNNVTFLNDTWTYSGSKWTNITASAGVSPSPRYGLAMATDPTDGGGVMLFGGVNRTQASNGTWYFARGFWSNLTTQVGPPPPGDLSWGQLAFDEGSSTDLLFLGSPSDSPNGTWAYNGSGGLPLTISSFVATPASVEVSQSTVFTVSASGGNGTLYYVYTGLPLGCSSVNAPALNCTPDKAGSYIIRVYVNDTASHSANATTTLTVIPAKKSTYVVAFTESGLPGGISWSVTFNGTPGTSSTSSIVFNSLLNNTTGYAFTVGAVSGYTASPSSGFVVVNGTNVTRAIAFTKSSGPTQYTVTFAESGLPSGTSWSVILNGTTKTSTTTTLAFSEPNNTYTYTVVGVPGYTDNPSSGSITANGGPAGASIKFTAIPAGSYSVTFNETGLPTGANWSVTLAGKTTSATGSTISFTEKNGTYNYTVASPAGYTATPASGSLTVAGKAVSESVAFAKSTSKTTIPVNFTETGLPSGTNWSVTVNGTTESSTTATITFQEVDGTYSYVVKSLSGYTSSPSSGRISVTGSSVGLVITFTSKTNQSTGLLDLPGYDGYILIGVIVAVVVAAVALLLLRKRSPPAPATSETKEPEKEKKTEKGEAEKESSSEPEKKG